ncbi:MAG: cytochrome c oxidase subunit II [Thermomicrobia bacterium]|nr:cytochrome c oxidase subunit II [Thermomicrobia bacterium]
MIRGSRFRSKPSTSRRSSLSLLFVLVLPILLSACTWGGNHSPLNPSSGPTETVNRLWWIMFWMSVVIEALVAGLVVISLIRFRRKAGDPDPVQISGNTRIEIAWTIAPAMILVVLLVLTLTTMVNISEPKGTTMRVTVTGHQWWWEFDYQGMNIVTGNEMHIPVDEPVHIDLRSTDVIHSFWVPSLAGKRDAIPGHDNTLWISANKPGTYRGECTEFCGPEHANMNFIVVAQPRAEFDAWVRGQQQPAATGQTGLAAEGAQTILTQACAGCHMINGVKGYNVGKIGPNLTHVGSRQNIAAGTLENTPENLARWIRNPQEVKPENKMPNLGLDEATIAKLVAYLESLK